MATATLAPGTPRLRIGRARLLGGRSDDREPLTQELATIRAETIGLRESALLIVPRLKAPRPFRRGDRSGGFAQGVAAELREAVAQAGGAGGGARAAAPLLFRDASDAAAALILQWLAGAPPSERAWWPLLTGGMEPRAWWRQALLAEARALPPVVSRLAEAGASAAWLAALEETEVEIAIRALASACGLVREVARAFVPPPPSAMGALRGTALSPAPGRPDREHSPGAEAEGVFAAVPEALQPTLRPRARTLLLLALLAHRRPELLATRAAAAALRTTLSTARAAPEQARARTLRVERAEAGRTVSAKPRAPADPPRRTTSLPIEAATAASPRKAAAAAGASIDSSFGGLFFLLNAFTALGLYGDCTRPRQSLPGLSPFALLHFLGRRWWRRAFTADALSALLVELAGGSRAASGADFEAPAWSVPAAWLAPWRDAAPTARRHPAGFPLLQPPATAAAQARRRWLSGLACYLDARIAAALGMDDRPAARACLCRRSAIVADDGGRLAVTFALDDHPLEIRLAGLDRDPGLLAGATRDVRFDFE